jgi:hypothetical protein
MREVEVDIALGSRATDGRPWVVFCPDDLSFVIDDLVWLDPDQARKMVDFITKKLEGALPYGGPPR